MFTGNKKQLCTNCGENGHSFRQCFAPVTSYGMILVRVRDGWNQAQALLQNTSSINGLDTIQSNIEYLLIQRRDSLGFVEIMRGKYKLQDIDYIRRQLLGTIQTERERLLSMPFDELWCGLWGITTDQQGQSYKSEKEMSRTKLETLRLGYLHEETGETISLKTLLATLPCKWETPEWGFPKGRRDYRESDFQCALREVKEETGLTDKDICPIRNLNPIQESFFGSNTIHYCHKYFIAFVHSQKSIEMDSTNEHMSREVGNISWYSLDEALRVIRSDNVEKREILLKTSSLLRNFCPLRLTT
jgi:8-oxo-dGTP pyrophosphatase MutT (NUDIX family)